MKKPSVSEISLDKRTKTFSSLLQCQEIKNFQRISNVISIPKNYNVSNETTHFTMDILENDLSLDDFIWLLARVSSCLDCESQIII